MSGSRTLPQHHLGCSLKVMYRGTP